MLILSRRAGQGIRIGDSIKINVISIDRGFVRIGLDAPTSLKILREELWHSIAEDNQESAGRPSSAQSFAQAMGRPASEEPGLGLEPKV